MVLAQYRRLWKEALLASLLWCPPLGLMALVYVARGENQYRQGNRHAAARESMVAQVWLRRSLYAGLAIFTAFAAAVFFHFGAIWVPALNTFY